MVLIKTNKNRLKLLLQILIFSFFCISAMRVHSQKELTALKINDEITVDGELDEACWKNATVASNFVMNYPIYGVRSNFETEVQFVYDNDAIYISAKLTDRYPDSVLYTLSQRDDFGNADWFGVQLDPYGKKQNGFAFYVAASGVELDAIVTIVNEDFSWNAVWKSAVKRTETGWQVEMKIPFSAFRFPKKDIQDWNINFKRQVRRVREMSFWNPVDPAAVGQITQTGKLLGIKNIESPLRLSFTPYLTGYLDNVPSTDGQLWRQRATGGLDLKYGINDAFTLDMTVIPDFGQTISDPKILNLGPYEVQYAENRPFFLEGTDLFGIGGLFYSRRIGGTPYNFYDIEAQLNDSLEEVIIDNPSTTSLINSTKISGRTKKGLGIGFLNAIESRSVAKIQDKFGRVREVETNPLTNYNVFVLSQNLENSSSVSFVNTNVFREGAAKSSNVTSALADFYMPNQTYKVESNVTVSAIQDVTLKTGHSLNMSLGKVRGVWKYSFGYYETDDAYNPNDLGYLRSNNNRGITADFRRNTFSPKGLFLRTWSGIYTYYEQLYTNEVFTDFAVTVNTNGTTKKFHTIGISGAVQPFGRIDHFESRTFGEDVKFNSSTEVNGFISSDYSRAIALDLYAGYYQYSNLDQRGGSISISPRVRFSSRLFMVLETSIESLSHDYGYVRISNADYAGQIILGDRNRSIVTNSIQTEFIFTKRMGIKLFFRHYWQNVNYNHFALLNEEGWRDRIEYNPKTTENQSIHNTSYNAFTIDMNYRWVFIPGSELRVVWKYNIFNSISKTDENYSATFNTLFDQPQFNSFSVKLLMYVDALYFRGKNKPKNG